MLTRKIYDEIKIWIPIHKAYKECMKHYANLKNAKNRFILWPVCEELHNVITNLVKAKYTLNKNDEQESILKAYGNLKLAQMDADIAKEFGALTIGLLAIIQPYIAEEENKIKKLLESCTDQ